MNSVAVHTCAASSAIGFPARPISCPADHWILRSVEFPHFAPIVPTLISFRCFIECTVPDEWILLQWSHGRTQRNCMSKAESATVTVKIIPGHPEDLHDGPLV